jgi:hypothetical protein
MNALYNKRSTVGATLSFRSGCFRRIAKIQFSSEKSVIPGSRHNDRSMYFFIVSVKVNHNYIRNIYSRITMLNNE